MFKGFIVQCFTFSENKDWHFNIFDITFFNLFGQKRENNLPQAGP